MERFRYYLLKIGLPLLVLGFLAGCSLQTAPIVDPKGPITAIQRDLLYAAFFIMLIVVIPVYIMVFWFIWRYRAKGGTGKYRPEWHKSTLIEVVIWSVPAAIIITLGYLTWTYTYKLDPYKKLTEPNKIVNVQVVALNWKWLFIYPDLGIASVNELAFPVDKSISLKLTSDTVMNSFLIPALGGQIYAMAGMTSELNLLADEPGRFRGRNTQYSGDGFSQQYFDAVAMTPDEFDKWVAKVRANHRPLSTLTYGELAEPTIAHDVEYFSFVQPQLFQIILRKYARRPQKDTLIETLPANTVKEN